MISVNNSLKYLGQFESEVAAAQAYDRAALESRGPKAQVNFRCGIVPVGAPALLEMRPVGTTDIPDSLLAQHIEVGVHTCCCCCCILVSFAVLLSHVFELSLVVPSLLGLCRFVFTVVGWHGVCWSCTLR